MLNGFSVFSGIAGLDRALEEWIHIVAYCENNRYAQSVLLSRMWEGRIPLAPIWDDIRTLQRKNLPEIDILVGGPPCQDFSLAGNGAGLEGDNGQLMLEYLRVLGELRPQYAFMENVPGLALRGLDQVLLGLDALRYDCRWTVVFAEEVGAPFLGERLFLLAEARGERHWHVDQQEQIKGSEGRSFARRNCENLEMAETTFDRCEQGGAEPVKGRIPFHGKHCSELEAVVSPARARLESGYLNPHFHAVMMGFEIDHTRLNAVGMQWWSSRPRKRS